MHTQTTPTTAIAADLSPWVLANERAQHLARVIAGHYDAGRYPVSLAVTVGVLRATR